MTGIAEEGDGEFDGSGVEGVGGVDARGGDVGGCLVAHGWSEAGEDEVDLAGHGGFWLRLGVKGDG